MVSVILVNLDQKNHDPAGMFPASEPPMRFIYVQEDHAGNSTDAVSFGLIVKDSSTNRPRMLAQDIRSRLLRDRASVPVHFPTWMNIRVNRRDVF